MKNNHLALALSGALSLAGANLARADISDNVVRVGVLNDISGIFQDTNGMGSVEAARMATAASASSAMSSVRGAGGPPRA